MTLVVSATRKHGLMPSSYSIDKYSTQAGNTAFADIVRERLYKRMQAWDGAA